MLTPINVKIVDDDPIVRMLHERLWRKTHANTILEFFESGEQLLDSFQSSDSNPKTDLIILDFNMNGLDGLSILKEIKKNKRLKEIPVVICSGIENPRTIKSCLESGAVALLPKNGDLAVNLQKVIREIVDK